MKINCLAVAGSALIMFSSASAEDAKVHGHPANRLAKESSPYLLLHAHNPVDWYPWGPEAFEKAQKEDKPVFLSIGYSSCYWCHVMERKVFSDVAIAKYMNEHFVNIKVDREERPDVDDIYMTSLLVYQQLAGSASGGGWPLSMFLTPDGNPIAGATYLPPADSPQGRGFPGVAKHISGLWKARKPELQRSALQIAEQVQRMTRPGLELQPVLPVASLVDAAVLQIKELYDPVWGGVGFHKERPHTPKFPNVSRLELLLDIYESSGDKELLKIVEQTLNHMANGGIRDHLGGGYHRYSTDRKWHVPHFEKMLYDQAMLLGIYARTAKLTDNEAYAVVASEIAGFIRREMTTTDGAFCSALDAETNAIEGEYYVWSTDQIEAILGKDDAAIFAATYGLNESNPFEHGFVLHLPRSLHDTASQLKMSPGELEERLVPMRAQLLNSRDQRERPLLDDKVLTAWNALMIRALAVSGRDLNRTGDVEMAKNAAEFLLKNLRDKDGHLLRTWRNGEAKFPAYLDDYAFLVAALLELHKTTNNDRWLTEARMLAELQNDLFYDSELQAFYYTANNHEKLIARISSVYDSVFPSANSISVFNLMRLNELNHSEAMITKAENTLTRFAATLERAPASCSSLAQALHLWLTTNAEDPLQSSLPEPQSRRFQLTSLPDESPKQTKPPAKDPSQHSTFRPVIGGAPGNGFAEDDKPKPLKVKIYPMYNKLPRKGKCLVAIELQVKLGWHINANPSNPDFLVPTKVEVKSKQKVKLTKIKYPKHHELKVDGSDEPYHVYDGKTIVYGLLEIDETNTTKFTELEFHVTFQGCNSTQCLPPDLVVMKGKLPVAAEGEELKKIHQDKFPKPPARKDTPAPPK